jgi:hypothetical protein
MKKSVKVDEVAIKLLIFSKILKFPCVCTVASYLPYSKRKGMLEYEPECP